MSSTSKNSHNFIKKHLNLHSTNPNNQACNIIGHYHHTSITRSICVKQFFLSARGTACKIQICYSNRTSLLDETTSRSTSTLLSSYFSSTTLADSKGFFSFLFQLFPLILLFILLTIIALYIFLQMQSRLRSLPIGFPLF